MSFSLQINTMWSIICCTIKVLKFAAAWRTDPLRKLDLYTVNLLLKSFPEKQIGTWSVVTLA